MFAAWTMDTHGRWTHPHGFVRWAYRWLTRSSEKSMKVLDRNGCAAAGGGGRVRSDWPSRSARRLGRQGRASTGSGRAGRGCRRIFTLTVRERASRFAVVSGPGDAHCARTCSAVRRHSEPQPKETWRRRQREHDWAERGQQRGQLRDRAGASSKRGGGEFTVAHLCVEPRQGVAATVAGASTFSGTGSRQSRERARE